jgi:hypothetical protein
MGPWKTPRTALQVSDELIPENISGKEIEREAMLPAAEIRLPVISRPASVFRRRVTLEIG